MTNTTTNTSSEHCLGRVKWFNNRAGYGFITVTDGLRSGSDIFVHHSAINVENQQYRYLVQGEYVEFDLVRTESETHEWQASNVAGVRGGKLMCETRRELKQLRTEYRATKTAETSGDDEPRTRMPRQRVPRTNNGEPRQRRTTAPRARGEGPRGTNTERGGNGWTLVSKDGPRKVQTKTTRQGATVITIQSK